MVLNKQNHANSFKNLLFAEIMLEFIKKKVKSRFIVHYTFGMLKISLIFEKKCQKFEKIFPAVATCRAWFRHPDSRAVFRLFWRFRRILSWTELVLSGESCDYATNPPRVAVGQFPPLSDNSPLNLFYTSYGHFSKLTYLIQEDIVYNSSIRWLAFVDLVYTVRPLPNYLEFCPQLKNGLPRQLKCGRSSA